eukprot:7157837-Prymnesium_polylepis.1
MAALQWGAPRPWSVAHQTSRKVCRGTMAYAGRRTRTARPTGRQAVVGGQSVTRSKWRAVVVGGQWVAGSGWGAASSPQWVAGRGLRAMGGGEWVEVANG